MQTQRIEPISVTLMPKSLVISTPTTKIIPKLKELSQQEKILADEFDRLLVGNPKLLETHSLPVLIPSQHSQQELYGYIQNHYSDFLQLMLSAWPFSISSWNIPPADREYLYSIAKMIYFPIVFNTVNTEILDPGKIAVSCFGPTKKLEKFLNKHIESHRKMLGEEYLDHLKLLAQAGVALVAECMCKSSNQSASEFVTILSDPRKFLKGMHDNLLNILFHIYFEKEEYYPKESADQHLDEWFRWNTYVGLYTESSRH